MLTETEGEWSTSVYSEVFHWNRGSNVSNMAELFFTDASRGAAHVSRLSLQCKKLYKQTHKHVKHTHKIC